MKIAIVGYGKMGHIIEDTAKERGHEVVATLNEKPTLESLNGAEVAIEFSSRASAFENVKFCVENHIPVVCGTTGWLEKKSIIEDLTIENKSAFLYGSNFSLGVNLFFHLNEKLAQMMNGVEEYHVQLEEIHHVHKLDAPSGTAITLAEGIIQNSPRYSSWKLEESQANELGIFSIREDEVPGTHSVFYRSEVDEIEIKHTAFNRKGFAAGAVYAAEWILGKNGVFSMKDVLGL